jgi:formylmethanofuran dehydrogenase subunit E
MNPKQRYWSPQLYERGSEFHGHGGPFMVIGLRMSLIALRLLDSKGWFGLTCTATLNGSPPDSCTLDGIQCGSGCTIGKHNLIVKEGLGVSAEFQSGQKKVNVMLKPEVYDEMKSLLRRNAKQVPEEHSTNEITNKFIEMEDDELFSVITYP